MKKWISGLTAITLAAVLLAGCGSGESSSPESSRGSLEGGEVELPAYEITGDKVTMLCWGDKKELQDETTYAGRMNALFKEKYNCELDYIRTTYEELPSKAAQLVLSDNSPDLIFYKQQDNPNFILNEIVQPVDDYIDFSMPLWADIKPMMDKYMYNGHYYMTVIDIINNGYVYYQKNMFVDAGLDTPLELYRSGKWTWSKFRELAQELTTDRDGDGRTDVYGCAITPLYFYMSCGEDFVKFEENGTAVNNMRSPAIANAMNFLFNLGSTQDGSRVQQGDGLEMFRNAEVAMLWNEAWVVSALADKFKDGSVEFAPAPMMDGADQYYTPGRINTTWLAAGAPNPGGAMAYLALERFVKVDPETKARFRAAEQEQTGFTDEVYALMDEMNSNKFVIQPNQMEGMGNWGNSDMFTMFNDLAQWDVPWSTVVETYYPVLQAQIEATNQKRAS